MDFNYCANPEPQDPEKLCRDIGPTNNFLDQKKTTQSGTSTSGRIGNTTLGKKGNMTKAAFFAWAEDAAALRNELEEF